MFLSVADLVYSVIVVLRVGGGPQDRSPLKLGLHEGSLPLYLGASIRAIENHWKGYLVLPVAHDDAGIIKLLSH